MQLRSKLATAAQSGQSGGTSGAEAVLKALREKQARRLGMYISTEHMYIKVCFCIVVVNSFLWLDLGRVQTSPGEPRKLWKFTNLFSKPGKSWNFYLGSGNENNCCLKIGTSFLL